MTLLLKGRSFRVVLKVGTTAAATTKGVPAESRIIVALLYKPSASVAM